MQKQQPEIIGHANRPLKTPQMKQKTKNNENNEQRNQEKTQNMKTKQDTIKPHTQLNLAIGLISELVWSNVSHRSC